MKIISPVFKDGEKIPSKYTCDSFHPVSPPLEFIDVPREAKSLVLIMDDPDVPKKLKADGVYDHWILFNIPPDTPALDEGVGIGIPGLNSAGSIGYIAPCPPANYEPSEHRYVFKLYALNTKIGLGEGSGKEQILEVVKKHSITECQLVGKYSKLVSK